MNKGLLILLISFVGLLISPGGMASEDRHITHIVMVWLKQPGNQQHKDKFIKVSKQFNDLPGVIHRHVGQVVKSDSVHVDDSFDLAVSVTLKNKAALRSYLNHPKHQKVLKETLKPLVKKTVIYNFESQ